MNKTIPLAAACAIAMATAAIAAPPPANFSTNADNSLAYAQPSSHGSFTPPLAHRSSLPVIYQNFATSYPKGLYNAFTGAVVSGPKTPHGEFWVASAFTPTANAAVQEVDVAAGFNLGVTNTVQLHIYADANGIPGSDLWVHQVALTQTFGACCGIIAVTLKSPLHLIAGTQYWLGMTTVDNGQTVWGSWNLGVADQVTQSPNAESRGSGWQATLEAPAVAFGIYGK